MNLKQWAQWALREIRPLTGIAAFTTFVVAWLIASDLPWPSMVY